MNYVKQSTPHDRPFPHAPCEYPHGRIVRDLLGSEFELRVDSRGKLAVVKNTPEPLFKWNMDQVRGWLVGMGLPSPKTDYLAVQMLQAILKPQNIAVHARCLNPIPDNRMGRTRRKNQTFMVYLYG